MHKEGQIPPVVEIPRNAGVEAGAPEKQMATYRRRNSTQENTHSQNFHSTDTCKCRYPRIQDKMQTGKRSKESRTDVREGQERDCT